MIASLVLPSPTLPHRIEPWSSGPRCRCASFIRATASRVPLPKIPAILHIYSHSGRIAPPRSPTCAPSHSLAPLLAVHRSPPRASHSAAPLHHQPESTNHSSPSAQTPTPLPSDPSQSPATLTPTLPVQPSPNRHNAMAHTTHPPPHTHAANHPSL